MSERRVVLALMGIAVLFVTLLVVTATRQVHADQQGPADQVTLNPGGGLLENGSDGVRFTINSRGGYDGANPHNYAYDGGDAMVYRSTYQYCCGGGSPLLNIGGVYFGQGGPASWGGALEWDSIAVISTSGSAVVGDRTNTTGNGSATVRYTATHNDLVYIINRTISYIYPNDYITDSYSFTIPSGNADPVKFYLGGDTAPGSSDSGYGIMLTSPVRSVISLNVFSRIMFGFREIATSRAFDGATSQHYSAPYGTVSAGGDIGFVVTESNHDAGLMMQWNLGSTPGTQTASLQQFATQQGTNLNATFASGTVAIDTPVSLDLSIVNTELTEVEDLGYTMALPSGLVIALGSQSNSCGGTLTAASGGTAITLSGASVGAGSNCIVSIPVISSSAGTYGVSSGSFSGLQGALTNNVGASSLTVSDPALGTDLNGDGTDDPDQPYVYGYTSSVTGKTVVLEVGDSCSVDSALSEDESGNETQDAGYNYVNGLMNFTVDCGTPGSTTTIQQYYYDVEPSDLVLRKYDPRTNAYFVIEGATLEERTINGHTVTVATYAITDGGELDTDGEENGSIVDPAGLAALAVEVPNTGLGGARR